MGNFIKKVLYLYFGWGAVGIVYWYTGGCGVVWGGGHTGPKCIQN